jgi:hypothetical protein
MLSQQGHFLLSNHSELYDKIIRKDSLLRQIKELIDFSFVRKELVNKYCPDNGQKLINHVKDSEMLTSVPGIKEKLNLLRETPDDIANHYTVSKDTDARTGHKTEDSSFFGYKTHIAMSEERIITAATVHFG